INRNNSHTNGNERTFYVGNNFRTLVKYNLSAVSMGTIKSAKLELQSFSSGEKLYPMKAYRVTQEWLEMEANWDEA
ncbi:DNRLRE domain-containing protein, partial [Desulfocucumis palustris]|uniref:DNRLRE domain-containing protein n=1 Tax=Desulfocucumis palustris TaxID=1898651 RepID=UPI0013FDB83E